MSSVLVVSDDRAADQAVGVTLRTGDLEVEEVGDGEAALTRLHTGRPDLVLLHFAETGRDGVATLRQLRGCSDVPVIVVSGRDRPRDKVAALDAGADDYVTTPFDSDELVARIRAALRRCGTGRRARSVVRAGQVEVDLAARQVRRRGRVVPLTRTERRLLEMLVRHPGELLTHERLLREVWGPDYRTESNYLRTYVGQLRKKLGDAAAAPRLIRTEPGVGYRWIAEPRAARR